MKTIIIGAGVHAGAILDILQYDKKIKVIGYTDPDIRLYNKSLHDFKVLGDDSVLEDKIAEAAVVGIGSNALKVREKVYDKAKKLGYHMLNAIHPSAIISPSAEMGDGNVIFAGVIINAYSKIGSNVVLYSGSIIEHDNVIEDHAYISPGVSLSGSVTVKENAFIGTGASVLPGITIGKNAVVGAGAVVIRDVAPNTTVAGVPAKIIKGD